MLTAKLIVERFDKDHRLLERREQPSLSFVAGFIRLLYVAHAQIQQAAPYSMPDITNTARNVDNQASTSAQMRTSKSTLTIGSPGGSSGLFLQPGQVTIPPWLKQNVTLEGSKVGIQVGTSNAAVTPTDVALNTRINHGRAAGQLEYGGCELINIAFADPNGSFVIRRYFTNYSGGAITVQEAGIYAAGTNYGTGASDAYAWPFCIARDVVAPGVGVNNTELLRVTYVVQITV